MITTTIMFTVNMPDGNGVTDFGHDADSSHGGGMLIQDMMSWTHADQVQF